MLFFALTFFSFIQHLHVRRSSRRARLALAPFSSKEELKSIFAELHVFPHERRAEAELRWQGGELVAQAGEYAGHGPFFTYKVF